MQQKEQDILYDLENPLTPESERSESVRMYREQEKEFYRKFIENLEEISDILDSVTRESVERTLVQSGNTFVKKTSLGGSLDIQI